jgi:type I restriction enzyme R subunit
MAEERGEAGAGTLQTRRCAVVIDEAHSSQGGETATDLKEVLGGEALRQEAQKRAAEEGREDLEELFRSMAKRGRQANLSFFAFTATPKHKTLAVFGRNGKPRTATRCGRRSKRASSSTCSRATRRTRRTSGC